MKIAYCATVQPSFGGLKSFNVGLVHSLLHLCKERQIELVVITHQSHKASFEVPEHQIRTFQGNHFLFESLHLPGLLKAEKVDVAIFPHNRMPLFSSGVPRSLLVIHDLLFWRFPSELTFLKRATRYFFMSQALKKAELIVAVSEFTKRELQEFGCQKSIGVCLEGVDAMQDNPTVSAIRFPDDKPYFLFIGAHSFQKNLPALVAAFDRVKKAGLDCRLILAGGKGTATQSVLDAVHASSYSSDIILPGFVSDEEKDWLMRNAIAFVFPSIYEGFGIPLLEAFQRNVPVITSDRASLPEVAGDGALISKPDPESLSVAMLEMAQNARLREELVLKGSARLQNFQWDLVGRNILNSIQEK